jgi:MULE transposase domain
MRTVINENPTRPVRRVYNECIVLDSESDDDDIVESTPQFSEVRASLNRYRGKFYPPIPRSTRDVYVRGDWKRTWAGKEFLIHQDRQWGLLIFMSEKCALKLQQCTDLYVDGTFSTCPKPYKQIVTIHGNYKDRVLPLAFCMLSSKTTALYREMFQQLQRHVRRITGNDLAPGRAICDFEIALMTAIQSEFPDTTVHGCFFHFCQSLWRKVQELGLATLCTQNRSVKKVIRKVMSLGYLPTALVRMTFNLIYNSRSISRLMNTVPALRDFIAYFNQNYINGIFKPALWNVFDRDVDVRTNNHVEGLLICLRWLCRMFCA